MVAAVVTNLFCTVLDPLNSLQSGQSPPTRFFCTMRLARGTVEFACRTKSPEFVGDLGSLVWPIALRR